MNQPYEYICPLRFGFPSHLGSHRVLSRVPCATLKKKKNKQKNLNKQILKNILGAQSLKSTTNKLHLARPKETLCTKKSKIYNL